MPRKRIKTKQCANCAYQFNETNNFCPNCGQENHHFNQSIRHVIGEFIETEFHFDNKFWNTARSLFTRPGEISSDFVADRRARYVPPIRLFVFSSFFFFLLVNVLVLIRDAKEKNTPNAAHTTSEHAADSTKQRDTSKVYIKFGEKKVAIGANTTKAELDSLAHGGFIERLAVNSKKMSTSKEATDAFMQHFMHYFSEALFLCMPLAAGWLYLLYIRRKRNYYEFLIFSIYYHSFVFIVLILAVFFGKLLSLLHLPRAWFLYVLFISLLVYFILSIKRVYQQSWLKTIVKSTIFMILYSVTFILVMVGVAVLMLGFGALH